jgi:hypothetical protein
VLSGSFNCYPQSFVLADRANFVVHPMLISVLGAGSVIEHGGRDLISSADASESLARSTNGGECYGDVTPATR